MMQAVLVNAMTGQEVNAKSFQRSYVGEEFDDYVYKAINTPFPFSPVGAVSRELTDLWKDRRFKIHYNGKWRKGKVISWKQYNPTPSAMITNWSIQVELDTVEAGDEVEVQMAGTVCRRASSEDADGTIVVNAWNGNGYASGIIIKPEESSGVNISPRMNLIVHRMNVVEGGTLRLASTSEEDEPALISLEWLEPPSPYINLNEDIVTFDCPCCRVTEPVLDAFDDSPRTMNAECPVCLETTECRKLSCGHGVCHSCWKSCRQAAMRVKADLDEMDDSQVEKEREKRNRLFLKKRGRDGATISSSSCEEYVRSFIELADAATDMEGLQRLRWELMVEHPGLWTLPEVAHVYDKLSISGLKVLLHVVETRKDEITDFPGGSHSLIFICAFLIATIHDKGRNYRAAVPWVEIALSHAQKSCRVTGTTANLRRAYGFASMIQGKADLLTRSLQSYDSSIELFENCNTDETRAGRDMILRELSQWRGSSGQLTRGV